MSHFQRVKNLVFGIFLILFAVALIIAPKQGHPAIAAVVIALVFLYGFKLLFYYFRMARHMVGGKATLCEAIIILDLALFSTTLVFMDDFFIIVYLLGIFAFTGVVDILRAFEAMKMKASNWKVKLITGLLSVVFVVSLVVVGIVNGNTQIIVYGYCVILLYYAVVKIATAFKRTAIVYIQ